MDYHSAGTTTRAHVEEGPVSKTSSSCYLEHRERAAASRLALEAALVTEGGEGVLLTAARRAVLALPPVQLLQSLQRGTVSAVAVLHAYQAKALEVSKRTNCVTEFNPHALARAKALDSVAPELRQPLHGLPVSVKDNIDVQGMDTTLGLLKRTNSPAEDDADVVKVIKSLGAIPFVKTNVAQIILTPGCSNPLWGETLHPENASRSCGGSSGGEGALIAEGGSVFGLGTDIAGSVRLPSNWCGIFGLKPTAHRISNSGAVNIPGPVGVYGTVGMMFRDAEILNEVTKAIFSANFHALNVDIPPLPWNDSMQRSNAPLRIGVLDANSLILVTPGVQRAVAEASAAFEKLGHTVVPFAMPSLPEGLGIFTELLMGDHGEVTTELLEGEIVDEGLSWYREFATVLPRDAEQAKPRLRRLFGDMAAEHSMGSLETVSDLWRKMTERKKFCDAFFKAWNAANLDLLMCCVSPCPAPQPRYVGKLTSALVFTVLFNLLDYPSIAVPITRQTQQDDLGVASLEPTDYIHKVIIDIGTQAVGLPLGVQIAGLPFQEEMLCRAAAQLSKAVNFHR